MSENGELLTVESLSVRFGGRTILDDASCSVRPGTITCLVGESGCGKTTLLKSILGLVPFSRGRVTLFGKDPSRMGEREFRELRLRLGVLFQNGALLNSLNVFENVAMPLEQHTSLPGPLVAEMVRARLAMLGVAHAAFQLPAELSGGMKKRVALARALMLEPELLFLDEPSAGLDPVTSSELDRLLNSLRNSLGATLVVVTHELRSIRSIADEIIFLASGSVAFQGTLAEAEESNVPEVRRLFNPGET
ncbi:MAG: ABC transporter ATP-binding protein [Alkalispirochaetaceae bacterium]